MPNCGRQKCANPANELCVHLNCSEDPGSAVDTGSAGVWPIGCISEKMTAAAGLHFQDDTPSQSLHPSDGVVTDIKTCLGEVLTCQCHREHIHTSIKSRHKKCRRSLIAQGGGVHYERSPQGLNMIGVMHV